MLVADDEEEADMVKDKDTDDKEDDGDDADDNA